MFDEDAQKKFAIPSSSMGKSPIGVLYIVALESAHFGV